MEQQETIYCDKHGHVIKEGMFLKHLDGSIEKIYKSDDNELGFNASNENWSGFSEIGRELYPIYQFNLKEYEIVDVKDIDLDKTTSDLTQDEKILVNTNIALKVISTIYEDMDKLSGAMQELTELLNDEKEAEFFEIWKTFPTHHEFDSLLDILVRIKLKNT